MKYKAVIFKITPLYISNETCQPVQIPSEVAMLDHFLQVPKYSFVEIYTKLKTIEGKTLRSLQEQTTDYAVFNGDWDIHTTLVNKI